MALEFQGSSLLPALPSCTSSCQVSWGEGEALWVFISWAELLLNLSEAVHSSNKMYCQSVIGVPYIFYGISLSLQRAVYFMSTSEAAAEVGQCLQSTCFLSSSQQQPFQQRCIINPIWDWKNSKRGEGNLPIVIPSNDALLPLQCPCSFPRKPEHDCFSHMLQSLPLAKEL